MEERYYEDETFGQLKLDGQVLAGYEFVDCTFENCAIDNCTLHRCKFSGCVFQSCSAANIKTESSQMKFAEFVNCNFVGINWSTLRPDGRFAAPISKIQNCRLKYNTFTGIAFRKFNFSGSSIVESMFGECELAESSFAACKLERTEFFRCDLRKADFRGATGYQIDIMSNQMKGAKFSYVEAINLLNSLDIKIE